MHHEVLISPYLGNLGELSINDFKINPKFDEALFIYGNPVVGIGTLRIPRA
jgi:hypothetical protein